ncbi:RICIN domain-containing protein [Endothiovibrio diazotrophicus]
MFNLKRIRRNRVTHPVLAAALLAWAGLATPTSASAATDGPILNVANGTMSCLGIIDATVGAGTQVKSVPCGDNAPVWEPMTDGRVKFGTGPAASSFCLDVDTANPYNGDKVQLWNCVGSTSVNQVWSWTGNGTLQLASTGTCIAPDPSGQQLRVTGCNAATQTWRLFGDAVRCATVDDGYVNQAPATDAVNVPNGTVACQVDGTGQSHCARWVGSCKVLRTGEPVYFRVFSDGYANQSPLSNAVTFAGFWNACVPGGICRKWSGRGTTASGAPVACYLFDDGFTNVTDPTDAIFSDGAGQVCKPSSGSGECRKWYGRCFVM